MKEDGERCSRLPMMGARTCASHVGHTCLVPEDPPPLLNPEDVPFEDMPEELESSNFLVNITDGREFAKAVLESRDFREYIVHGLKRREIPATLLLRLMDYAEGWGKPPERIEHTGKDGQPIETVTEVRRVVIRVKGDFGPKVEDEEVEALPPATTH